MHLFVFRDFAFLRVREMQNDSLPYPNFFSLLSSPK